MKQYKRDRQLLSEKFSRIPKPIKNQMWLRATRRVALDVYNYHKRIDDFYLSWDFFLRNITNELGGDEYKVYDTVKCDALELTPYYDIYLKCMSKLKILKEKSEYLNKNYIPLEDDLFEV